MQDGIIYVGTYEVVVEKSVSLWFKFTVAKRSALHYLEQSYSNKMVNFTMQHVHLWLNILTVIMGAGLFAYTLQCSRRESIALKALLLPVVMYNLLILLDSLSGYVHISFFPDLMAFKQSRFMNFLSPVTALVFLLFLYTAFRWLWAAADRKAPPWLQWVFKISPVLFCVFYTIHLLFYKDAGHVWAAMLSYFLILSNLVAMLIVMVIFTIQGLKHVASARLRQVGKMTLFYGAGLVFWVSSTFIPGLPQQLGDAVIPLAFNAYLFIWIPGFIKSSAANNGMSLNINAIDSFCKNNGVSTRQQEIMELLLEGKNNREIAELLYIAPHTVKNHIYNLYKKLGLKNRMELLNLVLNQQNEAHRAVQP
ncbi:helix-turn-helix transcriptional regulator [bacterium]|nr:helix-turn-helix transcriptional regulator [bacterium]